MSDDELERLPESGEYVCKKHGEPIVYVPSLDVIMHVLRDSECN